MARRKSEQFAANEVDMGNIAKALGHPARIKIVRLLLVEGEMNCKQIVAELPLSQSTVSQHLAELKQAGVIHGRGFRTSMLYSLEKETLKSLHSMLGDMLFPKTKPVQASLF